MIGTAVPARLQVERVRVALSADTFTAVTLTLFVGILALLTWGAWGDLDSDTGYDLVAAHRIAEGELPYRDFIYYYGPLAPALLGLAALVGGAELSTAIAIGLPVAVAIVGATYLLGRAVAGPLGGLLAGAVTAAVAFTPDNYSYVIPHTTDMTLGMLLLLGLLVAVWRYAETGHSLWLAACGAALGLLSLTKPEPAIAGLVAVGLWLIVRAWRGAAVRREIALVVLPSLLVAVPVYGALLAAVGPHQLVLENLYPVDYLGAAGGIELRNRMPLTLASFVDVAAKCVLYAIGVVALFGASYGLRRGGVSRRLSFSAIAVGGLVASAGALEKPEALRHGLEFAYGWIPVGAGAAVAILALRGLRQRGEPWSASDQLMLAGATALALLALTVYRGFFPHAPHEQMAAYYMPLAAVFLARLHLRELARTRTALAVGAAWVAFLALAGVGLAVKDARAESVAVEGPGGTLSETPQEARLYQVALDSIIRLTEPGDPIFAAPMMTGLYPLSQRWSPVDEISMLPGALPDSDDERRAIAALERAGVRFIVTDDRAWPGYEHGSLGDTFGRSLVRWIEANFERVASVTAPAHTTLEGSLPSRTLSVWTRRER